MLAQRFVSAKNQGAIRFEKLGLFWPAEVRVYTLLEILRKLRGLKNHYYSRIPFRKTLTKN